MCETRTLQGFAQDMHAILWKHFRQPTTNLLYMYIDPYTEGRINLPTKEQIEADIPNSNGWSTPLENCNYSSSQYLHTLLAKYRVTRRSDHAEQARAMFTGLFHLYAISKSPGYVPRGVLPDGYTHYKDVSIDHVSFWLMAMWSYYRSSLASYEQRQKIAGALADFAAATERNGWRFCREDGRLTAWGDLLQANTHRSWLVLLTLLIIAADVTQDPYWWRLYVRFRDMDGNERLRRLANTPITKEETWISSQTSWLLDTLISLDADPQASAAYSSLSERLAIAAAHQMEKYAEFQPELSWRCFSHRSETHRNVMFGLICLALCPSARVIANFQGLAERVIRHFNHRRDGKIVDLLDPIVRYYWLLTERGLLPYDPSADSPGDPRIETLPNDVPYPLHPSVLWYNSLTYSYHGLPANPNKPETQHYFAE